jgi:predicted flap endonuclease-1-like 5' DNA nuclease
MRLDFILYGLAALLFAVTAVILVAVSEADGRSLFALSTIILGVLFVTSGYFLKPKTQSGAQEKPVTQPPQAIAEPTQQPAPAEVPAPEAPKQEAPTVAPATAVETPPIAAETPKVAEPTLQTPVLTAPQPAPQLSAPEEVPALPAATSNLTKIRGISAARAEQLKAYGINSVEDLAKASPEDLAVKLAVSPKIVKMWVGSAKKQVK